MMKQWLGMVLLMSGAVVWAQEEGELKSVEKQIKQLQEIIQSQQKQIDNLAQKEQKKEIVEDKEKKGVAFKWNEAYGTIKLTGDVRFRYENQNFEEANGRDRLRTRLRLGGAWVSQDKSWEIGVGFASGKSSTSTNVTWAESGKRENFGSMSMDIDYVYAKHYLDSDWGMNTLIIGQVKNPFINAGILWDGDITPVGFTYGYLNNNFFATVGVYELIDLGKNAVDDKTWMFAAQAGLNFKSEKLNGKLVLGAYLLNNRNDTSTGASEIVDDNFQYQLLQAYGEVSTKIQSVKLTAFADIWYNVGATGSVDGNGFDQENTDGINAMGAVFGVKGNLNKFSAGLEYIYCGAFSSYWKLTDSDFGNGVNYLGSGTSRDVQGIRLKTGYNFNKNISLNATYLYYQRINDTEIANSYGQTVQVDLSYKF